MGCRASNIERREGGRGRERGEGGSRRASKQSGFHGTASVFRSDKTMLGRRYVEPHMLERISKQSRGMERGRGRTIQGGPV